MDYRIDADSPCFPANSPCGELIGALGVGCPAAGIGEAQGKTARATSLRLSGPSSNPVRHEARFEIQVYDAPATVVASVVAADGRLIQTIFDGRLEVGRHDLPWRPRSGNGRELPSGVYFLTVESRSRGETELGNDHRSGPEPRSGSETRTGWEAQADRQTRPFVVIR